MLTRRRFTHLLAHVPLLGLLPAATRYGLERPTPGNRIAAIEVLAVSGTFVNQPQTDRQWSVNPIHIYPDRRPDQPYRDDPAAAPESWDLTHHYVRIRTENGIEGLYGYVDWECIPALLRQVAPQLIGLDAMGVDQLWDRLYRGNRHARGGHYMMAISALDNALWDWRGRALEQPVYQLIGGTEKARVPVYGSCLGYSVAPGVAGPRAKAVADAGFQSQKWFLPYGPGDGAAGLRRNIELVAELRDAVGPDVELRFDAYQGWDLRYAVAWAKAVEPYGPGWIEEAFLPNQLDSFAQLSRETSIPVATGEHFYNRWQVLPFLQQRAIQVVQADPEWCGGVSELLKICHLASSFGVPVYPHGHNLFAQMHVVASQSPATCPQAEFLFNWVPLKVHFQKDPPLATDGSLPLNQTPGFGIELDAAKIARREILR